MPGFELCFSKLYEVLGLDLESEGERVLKRSHPWCGVQRNLRGRFRGDPHREGLAGSRLRVPPSPSAGATARATALAASPVAGASSVQVSDLEKKAGRV